MIKWLKYQVPMMVTYIIYFLVCVKKKSTDTYGGLNERDTPTDQLI